jgi:hypothetical protein
MTQPGNNLDGPQQVSSRGVQSSNERFTAISKSASSSRPVCSVRFVGSNPIVISQAAEFDYAGTQACRAAAMSNPDGESMEPNW